MVEECKHTNYRIMEHESIGWCTCLDCGKEVWFPEILNRDVERLQKSLKELENGRN